MLINHQPAGFLIIASIALLAACFVCSTTAEISCLDENGKSVDWFIGYKLPKFSKDKDPLLADGLAYVYLTSNHLTDEERVEALNKAKYFDTGVFLEKFRDLLLQHIGFPRTTPQVPKTRSRKRRREFTNDWVVSDKRLSDSDSLLSRTLAIAFDPKRGKSVSSVFYNDDPSGTDGEPISREDDRPNFTRAHAKGVLMMDLKSNSGVWITHSIPKYPNMRHIPFSYPDSGTVYGQTFMCISFDISETAGKLIDHLVNMRPLVYDNYIEDKLEKLYPALEYLEDEDTIRNKRVKVVPELSQFITTRDGQMMRIFSKSASFGKDLYSSLIDEKMGTDLFVETWRKGSGGTLDSTCRPDQHRVNNIGKLNARFGEVVKKWSYTNDHSKWAISEEKEAGLLCIGDSNRAESQFKRGGGAVCIKCATCWSVFNATITEVEPCPIPPRKTDRRLDQSLIERIREALRL